MKKRYWITALILFALGLFFYFFVYAYQFTGIVLCGLGVLRLIFGFLNLLTHKIFGLILTICVIVGLVAMAATGIWIGVNMGGADEPQAEYVVVLGAGVNGTQPSASLLERLEAAQTYAQTYPNAILVLSGAQGENEQISEAQCMYDWLIEHGISSQRLRKEENATTTQENLSLSVELIEQERGEKPTQIAVISSEYHLLRASLIADELGVETLGYPAETENKLFLCNMLGREIFAVWETILK